MEIAQKVYEALKADTLGIAQIVGDLDEVEGAISSGKYTTKHIEIEWMPKRDRLRSQLADAKEATLSKIRKIVDDYKQEQEAALVLDPAALTDDYKLLVSGIELTERDLCAILDRSGNNLTMQQMTHRYAKQHNVQLPKERAFMGDSEAAESVGFANGLYDIASRYTSRYMVRTDGLKMLDKFFLVEG
ncbi:hypothetical protein [Adlercreutzia sp. ZJ242]|uniref:hypothetical protein n=1 Tax=Adlercreutzia sp. ZJ242 TaxID=2709409 RepID=UPI0013EABFF8|nr:hypothetical protein [Adlercreutzia sp. ZJ242]